MSRQSTSAQPVKLTERMAEWERLYPGRPFYSFEFFPPKTETGVLNLYDRIERMATINPLWVDVTWGAGGSTADKTLDICGNARKYYGVEPLMHLTCTNMRKDMIDGALETCMERGIRNILALRGDPPANQERWTAVEGGFHYAADLVKYIRKQYGNEFCIAVAGYPEGHLENADKEDDLRRLKEKVDAGADLIITQLFYDVSEFVAFVKRCREIGINVPIVPGIMPIQSYNGFKRMVGFCKTKVPQQILDELEKIKDDEQAVKDYGVKQCIDMCREIIATKTAPGLHFYTLNLEVSVMKIVDTLGLIDITAVRELPWKPSIVDSRKKEDVRPIFWANRPRSYIHRTSAWDDFPNGRWGTLDSPAFGEPFFSMCVDPDEVSVKHRRAMWGESPTTEEEVHQVFVSYLKGDGKVKRLPWCPDQLGDETNILKKQLVVLNAKGCLTINSQPRVNGAISTDPFFGWGPRGGFVYQKAYAEFFCSPTTLEKILKVVEPNEAFTWTAVNQKGEVKTNTTVDNVNAVTWGVFPGAEIKQPTVVDHASFLIWKDEAFGLWTLEWASCYAEGTPSRDLIETIQKTWYLVNIVDNNFVAGDLFGTLIAGLNQN